MAKWNKLVITDAGYQLSAETIGGKHIQYTHAQTTSTDMTSMTSDQLKALTELPNVAQDLPVGVIAVEDDHTVDIPVSVSNNGLKEDYLLYGLAVFAKPEDGDEILYGVATAIKPELIPAFDKATYTGVNFRLQVHVGNSENVTIVIAPDDAVTNAELDARLKNYPTVTEIGSLLPDDIARTGADNAFTGANDFQTATVKGVNVATAADIPTEFSAKNLLVNSGNPTADNPVRVGLAPYDIAGSVSYSDGAVNLTSNQAESYYRFIIGDITDTDLVAGETYTLQGLIKGDSTIFPSVRIATGTKTGVYNRDVVLKNLDRNLSDTYQQYSGTFTIPSDTVAIFIGFQMYTSTGNLPIGLKWSINKPRLVKGDGKLASDDNIVTDNGDGSMTLNGANVTPLNVQSGFIQSGNDLNSFISDGMYSFNSHYGIVPNNVKNFPITGTGNVWGTLSVNSGDSGIVYQQIVLQSGEKYYRAASGDPLTFHVWQKVQTNVDTTNWQKKKVTRDDGGPMWYLGSGTSVTAQLKANVRSDGSMNGFYSAIIIKGGIDSPAVGDSLVGTISVSGINGYGIFQSSYGNAYAVHFTSTSVTWQTLATTAMLVNDYISKDQLTTILADYIKVDPNTHYAIVPGGKLKLHYGDLLLDDDVVGVTKWVYDKATAEAQTAIYPANLYLVGDNPSTTGGAS